MTPNFTFVIGLDTVTVADFLPSDCLGVLALLFYRPIKRASFFLARFYAVLDTTAAGSFLFRMMLLEVFGVVVPLGLGDRLCLVFLKLPLFELLD